MHTGYTVFFCEKRVIGEKWGILARFNLSQEDEAAEMVKLFESGEIINSKFGWLDPEKYYFGYVETWW